MIKRIEPRNDPHPMQDGSRPRFVLFGISVAATEILHRISNEPYDAFDVNPSYVQVMTASKQKNVKANFSLFLTEPDIICELNIDAPRHCPICKIAVSFVSAEAVHYFAVDLPKSCKHCLLIKIFQHAGPFQK